MKASDDRARVLVVDDEPSICRALTMVFNRAGYYVRAIERGETAEALLREEQFDCLVVDLRMPDMRGDVLYLTACSVQPHLRAQTVFTTGDASERATQLLRDCECPVVLQKPFDIDDLLDIVHAMTAHRARRVSGE
jgi:DNA-binding NtrC family response regulator